MTTPSAKGHVYFGSEEFVPRDNNITVKETTPGHVQVHLGFLQYDYTYSMNINIPKCYFLGFDVKEILDAAEKSIPNINCKVVSIQEHEDSIKFVIEFHAQKERLLKEELKFCFSNDEKLNIEFNARVLGPGKGTPLLKNGIRCISIAKDELSEASDWQG